MKALFDLFPVIIFFAVFYLTGKDFMPATGALIAATCIQMAITWWRNRTIEKLPLYSAILVVLLGGITLALDDPEFVQWKPTLLYWVLGAVLLGGQLLKKNLTQKALEGMYDKSGIELTEVPSRIWGRLNLLAVVFLALIGIANIFVAYHFSLEFWVNFKLFGLTALTMLFMIILTMSLSPYMVDPKKQSDKQS